MPRVPTMAVTATATSSASASPAPPQSALSSLISSYTTVSYAPQSPQLALALTVLHNLQYQHSWTALSLHALTACGRLISIPTPALSSPSISSATATAAAATITTTSNNTIDTYLISGLPPKHSYIHPSLQNHLVRRRIDESRLVVQPEWVLPVGTATCGGGGGGSSSSSNSTSRSSSSGGRTQQVSSSAWTLRRLCAVFDALPRREVVTLHSKINRRRRRQQEEEGGEGGEEGKAGKEEEAEDEEELGIEWQDAKRVVMGMLAANGKGGDGTIVYYIMQEGEVKPRQNG